MELEHCIEQGIKSHRRSGFGREPILAKGRAEQARIWKARKAGLGILARQRGPLRSTTGIEDAAVPAEKLARYMQDLSQLLSTRDIEAAYYAHASAGCIHVRPILDLRQKRDRETLDELKREVLRLSQRHGGVQSSEHGDGIARSHLNELQFGTSIYQQMRRVKQIFDPDGLFNPGKIVDADPQLAVHGLREVADQAVTLPSSIELCNGAGVCRKLDLGTMCPSFQITRDELHSTRGRANALRAALAGRLDEVVDTKRKPDTNTNPLASDAISEAMDLCIACKACKRECPSSVDMARMKMESRAARNAQNGLSLRRRMFSNPHRMGAVLCRVPRLANLGLRVFEKGIGKRIGIAPERRLPRFAKSAPAGSADYSPALAGSSHPLTLKVDCFSRFYEPEILESAIQLVQASQASRSGGTERGLRLDFGNCCGRPALSQGRIDLAMRQMKASVESLADDVVAGRQILVLEPSCASALRDEMPDLLPQHHPELANLARSVSDALVDFESWAAGPALENITFSASDANARNSGDSKSRPAHSYSPHSQSPAGDQRTVLVHPHCHQRALQGPRASIQSLIRVPGIHVVEPDAGCCGMAGSFGFEAEHYEASCAMAELRLMPAVRELPSGSSIIAAGTSCRQQLRDLCDSEQAERVVHPAVFLAGRL